MSDKKEDNECGTYDCETCPNLACGGVPASIPKDSGKQLERGEIRIECPFCHNIEIEEGMWVKIFFAKEDLYHTCDCADSVYRERRWCKHVISGLASYFDINIESGPLL